MLPKKVFWLVVSKGLLVWRSSSASSARTVAVDWL